MTTIYLGTDIAKATFEAAIDWQNRAMSLGEFNNNPSGYQQLSKALMSYTKSRRRSGWLPNPRVRTT